MKSPKGFRGKYFLLAAILAFSTTIVTDNVNILTSEEMQLRGMTTLN